jgi:cell fate (sporulation/competence/biofilm development) regulator YlbF (YheA/YmcA/DUF963 family)
MKVPLIEPAICDPGGWGIFYSAKQMPEYVAASQKASHEAMQRARDAWRAMDDANDVRSFMGARQSMHEAIDAIEQLLKDAS